MKLHTKIPRRQLTSSNCLQAPRNDQHHRHRHPHRHCGIPCQLPRQRQRCCGSWSNHPARTSLPFRVDPVSTSTGCAPALARRSLHFLRCTGKEKNDQCRTEKNHGPKKKDVTTKKKAHRGFQRNTWLDFRCPLCTACVTLFLQTRLVRKSLSWFPQAVQKSEHAKDSAHRRLRPRLGFASSGEGVCPTLPSWRTKTMSLVANWNEKKCCMTRHTPIKQNSRDAPTASCPYLTCHFFLERRTTQTTKNCTAGA